MKRLTKLGLTLRTKAVRRTPDPFVLAIALTALAFAITWVSGQGDLTTSLRAWSGSQGLWRLLRFAMQAGLMLLLGGVLADAPVFRRTLARAARRLRRPELMVAATAACSVSLALVNWSLSIVGGALFARACGQQARRNGWDLHYPLLCAAGYSGLMVWHGGLSGTAPLKVTRQDDLQELLGQGVLAQPIPLQETLLSPLNLTVNAGLLVLAVLLFYGLTPAPGEDPEPKQAPELHEPIAQEEPIPARLHQLTAWGLALLLGAAALVQLTTHGIGKLDLNILNLVLWATSLAAHGRLDHWLDAAERNAKGCAGILVQFPLYAGIMGLLTQLGLTQVLTQWMANFGETAMLLGTFASAAVLNVFVPSGGGQWAIQGPVLMEVAQRTGQSPGALVMAMAYGDQLTNMIQPFWALPLLGITGVKAKEISGYCLCWMICGGLWIATVLVAFSIR